MRPQKVLLFDEAGADEDIPALLIACPICKTPAGLWCGIVEGRGARREPLPVLRYVHSLRARRGAGVHKRKGGR